MTETKVQETIKKDVWVNLDIGGKLFKTTYNTLTSIPGSLLSSLSEDSQYFDPTSKAYNFDRDSSMFKHILDAYRTGELHIPRHICPRKFRKEVVFWAIPIRLVPSCCWKILYEVDEEVETLDMIIESSPNNAKHINKVGVSMENMKEKYTQAQGVQGQSLRERIWIFLEEPQTSTAAKIWCFAYIVVVLVSVLIHLMWIDKDIRSEPYLVKFTDQFDLNQNNTIEPMNEKIMRLLFMDPHMSVFIIDVMCMIFFVAETIVHFAVCPNKFHYIINGYNVIKALLSISLIAALVTEVRKDLITSVTIGRVFLYIKTMNMFRVLLILRLRKLYNNFHIILLSMQRSGKELLLLLVVFGSTVLVYGGIMFCVEIEGEMFPNTRTSMWWALITMTTVGYGDFYPTTQLGYIIGCLCAINGLVVIALPIAAIASNFADICSRNADYQKYLVSIQTEQIKEFPPKVEDKKSMNVEEMMSADTTNEKQVLVDYEIYNTEKDRQQHDTGVSTAKTSSVKDTASSKLKKNVKK